MSAYELQVYQNGGWQFDSYFDNRELVLSEAERLDAAKRYLGVRVLEEIYNEEKQSSSYKTIFSRLRRNEEVGGGKGRSASASRTSAPPGAGMYASRRGGGRPAPAKSSGSIVWPLIGGIFLVVIGVVMVYILREFSGSY